MRPVLGRDMILGVGESLRDKRKTLTVYPNPVSQRLYLTGIHPVSGQPVEIAVYNLFGQLILRQDLHQNFLDVHLIRNGMYLLRVQSANRTYTSKFIVKH